MATKGALRSRALAKAGASAFGAGVVRAGRGCHRFVREFEPWGIVFTVLGLAVALVTIVIDLEDRQSDRVFRAWQVVREFEIRNLELDGFSIVGAGGSSMREAVELLNREFDGFMCVPGVGWISEALTGNDRRECLIPKKKREWLTGLKGPFAYLMEANLRVRYMGRGDVRLVRVVTALQVRV